MFSGLSDLDFLFSLIFLKKEVTDKVSVYNCNKFLCCGNCCLAVNESKNNYSVPK